MEQIRRIKTCPTTACIAFGFLFLCLGLSSALPCSAGETTPAAEAVTPATPEPVRTSRLRMFGQNGAMAVLYRGSACVKDFWSEDGERVSGSLGSAFSSFFGTVSNTSLGIPETETSRNLSSRDGLLSKAYFREYLIPSGQPSSMRLRFQDVSPFYMPSPLNSGSTLFGYEQVNHSCHGAISFVPGPEKDYEVAFSWQGKTCHGAVSEVVRNGDTVELVPVPVSVAPDC
jgi:hypothetical protein